MSYRSEKKADRIMKVVVEHFSFLFFPFFFFFSLAGSIRALFFGLVLVLGAVHMISLVYPFRFR